MKYEDNTSQVQKYVPGQEVPMYFAIRAPHSGLANVSIVETKTNAVLGESLKRWDEYALTSEPMRAEWQNFTVKMPEEGLKGKCTTGGECILQM